MSFNTEKDFSAPSYCLRLVGRDKQWQSFETFYVRYYKTYFDLETALKNMNLDSVCEPYSDISVHVIKTEFLPTIKLEELKKILWGILYGNLYF